MEDTPPSWLWQSSSDIPISDVHTSPGCIEGGPAVRTVPVILWILAPPSQRNAALVLREFNETGQKRLVVQGDRGRGEGCAVDREIRSPESPCTQLNSTKQSHFWHFTGSNISHILPVAQGSPTAQVSKRAGNSLSDGPFSPSISEKPFPRGPPSPSPKP